jgi:8-oxo-dGTP diphosphatase
MKDRKDKTRTPILAAGGIVLRGDRRPHVAIVQLRKLSAWVLPKGKLVPNESAIAAARREVLEETGHKVSIHEFLGTLAYETGGRPKIVQFWRMQTIGGPVRDLMRDVKAVAWLPLDDAVAQLTHAREQLFLEQVGPVAIKSAERSARRPIAPARRARTGVITPTHPASRAGIAALLAPDEAGLPADDGVPLIGADAVTSSEAVAPVELLMSAPPSTAAWPSPTTELETPGGRNLIEKTLVWFRQATLPLRRE